MNPIQKFIEWLDDAKANKSIAEPTAMTLATVDSTGAPSARIVLLKGIDERGFVFYTNFESRKGSEIKQNPNVALCFHWMPLERQVRVEGHVEQVSDAEADVYFASRARDSQIGAWASKQSQDLGSREELLQAVAQTAEKFEGKPVARPPHWSGWRVIPERIEFWQQGDFRIHDRDVFIKSANGWTAKKLYP
jgi:pyridoxamine 5'-phosphate oxidase